MPLTCPAPSRPPDARFLELSSFLSLCHSTNCQRVPRERSLTRLPSRAGSLVPSPQKKREQRPRNRPPRLSFRSPEQRGLIGLRKKTDQIKKNFKIAKKRNAHSFLFPIRARFFKIRPMNLKTRPPRGERGPHKRKKKIFRSFFFFLLSFFCAQFFFLGARFGSGEPITRGI